MCRLQILAEVLAADGGYHACPADRPGRTEAAGPRALLAEERPLAPAKERAASL